MAAVGSIVVRYIDCLSFSPQTLSVVGTQRFRQATRVEDVSTLVAVLVLPESGRGDQRQ
jgi:hypothetical protein